MALLSWLLPMDHAKVNKRILSLPCSQSLGFISTHSSEVVTHITGLRQQVVKSVPQREHLIKEVLRHPLTAGKQRFQSLECQCFVIWSIRVNDAGARFGHLVRSRATCARPRRRILAQLWQMPYRDIGCYPQMPGPSSGKEGKKFSDCPWR